MSRNEDADQRARELASFIAGSTLATIRELYPEPMRHASGCFAKTLRGVIEREAARIVRDHLDAEREPKR